MSNRAILQQRESTESMNLCNSDQRFFRFSDTRNSLDLYLDDIDREGYEPLSREEEITLAIRIQQGDLHARNQLVQANLRFVVNMAKGYCGLGLSLAELISAGNVGLITAAERFDGSKGFKFISYAVFWIKKSIQRSLARQTQLVHLPAYKQSLLRNALHRIRRLAQEGKDEPEVEELAEELDIPIQDFRDLRERTSRVSSLNQTFGEKDSLLNILPDSSQPAPDADALRTSGRERLARILADLDERGLLVLRLYFGLEGGEAQNLGQIGHRLGVTRERARQIKDRALSQLRHSCRFRDLLALRDEVEIFEPGPDGTGND